MPLLKREPALFPEDLFTLSAIPADGPAAQSREAAPHGTNGYGAEAALHWWVGHVRSRQEKVLARHLRQCEVPYYLPQREHVVRSAGRRRVSYLPLFTGYVFFRGHADERLLALKSNVLVRVIDGGDDGSLARELHSLWLLQRSGAPLTSHPYVAPGDEVEVLSGAFKGYQGMVIREKGKCRLVVSIHLLRQSIAAELDRELLAPAKLDTRKAPPPRRQPVVVALEQR